MVMYRGGDTGRRNRHQGMKMDVARAGGHPAEPMLEKVLHNPTLTLGARRWVVCLCVVSVHRFVCFLLE